jgi:hypothetical protein
MAIVENLKGVLNVKLERVETAGKQFPPFLKASDLEDNEVEAEITSDVRETKTGKLVFNIKIGDKEYTFGYLNATNRNRLIDLLGEETSNWVGKKITLIKVMATNPKTKQEVETIRVKPKEKEKKGGKK